MDEHEHRFTILEDARGSVWYCHRCGVHQGHDVCPKCFGDAWKDKGSYDKCRGCGWTTGLLFYDPAEGLR
jgi:hypothetical protein